MQCPDCGHQAPVADFGEPLRCPDCGIYYEKAVHLKALEAARSSQAVTDPSPTTNFNESKHPARQAPRKRSVRWIAVYAAFAAVVVAVAAYKEFRDPGTVVSQQHVAPIESGAIPDRIGCDNGCSNLNKFEGWQPYLERVAEVHRRQEKCKLVEDVGVDQFSDPANPVFIVMCKDDKGRSYNTEYSKSQIQSKSVARSDDVTRAYAMEICSKELPRYFSGYFDGAVTGTGFYVAPNGRAQVTYDLLIAGQRRSGRCLVGHDFVEFTVAK